MSSTGTQLDNPTGTVATRVVQVATPETAARLGPLLERLLGGPRVSTCTAAELVSADLGQDVLLVVEPGAQQERDGLALVSELRAKGALSPALVILKAGAEPAGELPASTAVLGEHTLSEERVRAALSDLGLAIPAPSEPGRPQPALAAGAGAHPQGSGLPRLMRTVELQQITIADLRGRLLAANEELSESRSHGETQRKHGVPEEVAGESLKGDSAERTTRAVEELEGQLARARKERVEGEARLAQAMTAVESSHRLIEGLRADILRLSNELVLEQAARDEQDARQREEVRGLAGPRHGEARRSEPEVQTEALAAALEEATTARERAEIERLREVERREVAEALLEHHQSEARADAEHVAVLESKVAERNELEERRRIAESRAADAARDSAQTREDLDAQKMSLAKLQSDRDQLEKDLEATTARLADSEQSRGRLGSEIQELLVRAERAEDAEQRLAQAERRCRDLEGELAARVQEAERPGLESPTLGQQDEWNRLEELVRLAESQRAEVEGELAAAVVDLDRTRELLRKERLAALSDEESAPRAGDRLVRELRMDLGEWEDN